jgi:pSer/pThr/pTyr-binding forkhead associated (FHA) protein
MPLLYVLSGPSAGDTYEVKDGTTLVGRGPDNDLQIIEQSISRKHARLILSGERLLIEDLGSQNGTQLNGHPVGSHYQIEVKEGDFISLGSVLMSLGKPSIPSASKRGLKSQQNIFSIKIGASRIEKSSRPFMKCRPCSCSPWTLMKSERRFSIRSSPASRA